MGLAQYKSFFSVGDVRRQMPDDALMDRLEALTDQGAMTLTRLDALALLQEVAAWRMVARRNGLTLFGEMVPSRGRLCAVPRIEADNV